MQTKVNDPVRELYLEKCTPEEHIQLLELEIKMNEEKIAFYNKSPLYKDQLQQLAMIQRHRNQVNSKLEQIKKLQKKINNQ